MLTVPTYLTAFAFFAVFMPTVVSAMTLVQFLGLFHLFVGVYITATLGIFAVGVFVYFARLNTWPSHRDLAIRILEWAVAMLFVLVVLLGIVQFFQTYPSIALTILVVVVVLALLIIIVRAAGAKKKAPPARPGARPGAPPARH